ncbi:MAG TPA: hypothetical protein VKZ18_10840 [Polyangia bacterium]|nr:hypothetical protein [Polyangia bacterium]
MDLATHQRTLLGLFRGSYQVGPHDDPHIRTVAQSRDLEEAKRNIFLWRVYVLERTCALTFTLLRQRGRLASTIGGFIAGTNISPFRETQAPAFLETLSASDDPLVASVARFELALMLVREADARSYTIEWNVDPHSVLDSLARNLPLDEAAPRGTYQTLVSRELPSHFIISGPARPETDVASGGAPPG